MNAETGLRWLLRFIGVTTVPAMVAAVMPQAWFGLRTLFSTATSGQHAGFFWILVCDFGEGLLQGIVLVVLLVLTASRDVREGMKVMHSRHPKKP